LKGGEFKETLQCLLVFQLNTNDIFLKNDVKNKYIVLGKH